MKLLVTLAVLAVCVSAEELTRHKRGWGYETTTQGWTQPTQGWTQPTPPPPPPPTGWGWTTQAPPGWGKPTQGWSGWNAAPPSGWGSNYYNQYQSPTYRRPWGGSRYGRDTPYRYRDYDTFSSVRSPYSRRSSYK